MQDTEFFRIQWSEWGEKQEGLSIFRVVLVKLLNNRVTPFVVYYENQRDEHWLNTYGADFHHGDYCRTLEEALEWYKEKFSIWNVWKNPEKVLYF